MSAEEAFADSFRSLYSRPKRLSGNLLVGDESPKLPMKMVQAHTPSFLYRISIALWNISQPQPRQEMNVYAKARRDSKNRDLLIVSYRLEQSLLVGEVALAEVTRPDSEYNETDLAFLRSMGLVDIALKADQASQKKTGFYAAQYFPDAAELVRIGDLPELVVMYPG